MGLKMVKEHTLGQMETSMLENSRVDYKMVKERSLFPMEESIWGNSRMGTCGKEQCILKDTSLESMWMEKG